VAKILILDIETLPNVVTSWGLWVDGPLSHDNILKERSILCRAWKWLGEKQVHSAKAGKTDVGLLKLLSRVINQSDAVVAHNGDHFDIPWIRARLVKHGLKPLKSLPLIDTKLIAKKNFYFNSNRLDYLGKFLGVGSKIHTEYALWLDCMKGDKAAMEKMLRYNREDVRLLERVYLKLRPFVPAKLNQNLPDKERKCPACGSEELQARGFGCNRVTRYRRYQCQACGHWSSKPEKSNLIR